MITLQEQFEKDFPNKSVREINIDGKYNFKKFTNWDLDLSKNVNLTELHCSSNKINSLDLSKNVNLTELDCHSNNLTSLDLSKNIKLYNLDCSSNNLTSLDLSKNVNLGYKLYCHSNNLTSLDLSKNVNLYKLDCSRNNLTSLDLSKNVDLKYNLDCSHNNLTSLDLSKNLTRLYCHSNNLTSLDLSKNVNLTELDCHSNNLTSLDLNKNVKLYKLDCHSNNLTSLDFLKQLLHPEKLETLLKIYDNNIQSTDISIFSKFVNLRELRIGTTEKSLKEGKHNKFYGSLKAYQYLTKLEEICIEATDVNEGLEYLPFSLAQSTKEEAEEEKRVATFSFFGGEPVYRKEEDRGGYGHIECSPHNTNAKCSQIQDQLRPFNYDLEAWH